MGTRDENPHCPGTPEHLLWERYHEAYDAQPALSRLFDLHMQFQDNGGALLRMSAEIEHPHLRDRLTRALQVLEKAVTELETTAEHLADVEETRGHRTE